MTRPPVKVGVLTFHFSNNYGALLQCYALQRRLRDLGAEPEVIDYSCDYITKPGRLVNLRREGLFGYLYTVIGRFFYRPRRKKCAAFRKLLRLSPPVPKGRLDAVADRYDVYLAGSDQIWDHKLTDFDRTYFLDFVKPGRRKCSYAASLGEHLPPEELQGEYRRLLAGFDRILTREPYGADVVEALTGKRPACACDPTLLLTAAEWGEVLVAPKRKGPYILCYQLGVNRAFPAFVRRLAKKTRLPVVYIPFPMPGLLKCTCHLALGPAEWMGYFKNAEYVVTDSFHGAVFALLFNRKFWIMTSGHHVNRRARELLAYVGLADRTTESATEERLTEAIDFAPANAKLEALRAESLALLKETVFPCT